MIKSNKILLKSLLTIEYNLGKTQKLLENSDNLISIRFNFNNIYDLFEVIISAFNISVTQFDTLYDILDNLYSNKISVDESVKYIESLIND